MSPAALRQDRQRLKNNNHAPRRAPGLANARGPAFYTDMTFEEINLAIHLSLGWEKPAEGRKWRNCGASYCFRKPIPGGGFRYDNRVPEYCESLMLMYFVESTLSDDDYGPYDHRLAYAVPVDEDNSYANHLMTIMDHAFESGRIRRFSATPMQKALAYLRHKGLLPTDL
jgi:hypothetical protein